MPKIGLSGGDVLGESGFDRLTRWFGYVAYTNSQEILHFNSLKEVASKHSAGLNKEKTVQREGQITLNRDWFSGKCLQRSQMDRSKWLIYAYLSHQLRDALGIHTVAGRFRSTWWIPFPEWRWDGEMTLLAKGLGGMEMDDYIRSFFQDERKA